MSARLFALSLSVIVCFVVPSAAIAGQIWTDFDDDGLPDPSVPFPAPAGSSVTFDVWVDSQSFVWTAYLAYVEWTPGALTFQSAEYVVSGGWNFPLDRFSHPYAVGFGGSYYEDLQGTTLIGSVTLNVNEAVAACVSPIIDTKNPYYVFCGLFNGQAYFLFSSNPGTCFNEGESGACCFANGVCVVTSPDSCSSDGGVYQGDGVSCPDADCPQPPPQACCLPSGGCRNYTPADCLERSGTPQGDGTSCATTECPDTGPDEACCFGDCICLDRPPAECIALGGTPQGPGTRCYTTPCGDCPTQICCFPDASCVDMEPGECEAAGGRPQGANTTCELPLYCEPWMGCCFPDMSCQDMMATECVTRGGIPSDLPCSEMPCPTACCLPTGDCYIATPLACAQNGGISFPGMNCSQTQCVPNSTESASWGRIKGLFR